MGSGYANTKRPNSGVLIFSSSVLIGYLTSISEPSTNAIFRVGADLHTVGHILFYRFGSAPNNNRVFCQAMVYLTKNMTARN